MKNIWRGYVDLNLKRMLQDLAAVKFWSKATLQRPGFRRRANFDVTLTRVHDLGQDGTIDLTETAFSI
jgi:hypothetical protein